MIYRRKKDKNIRKVYPLRLLCSIIKEVYRNVMCMKNLPFSVVPSAFPVALDIVNDVTTIAALSKYAHILFCFRMFSPYLSVDY